MRQTRVALFTLVAGLGLVAPLTAQPGPTQTELDGAAAN